MGILISVNGEKRKIHAAPDTPLLWVLRDELKLTGTKFGCGIGACGACTVHIDGKAVPSCQIPVAYLQNKQIVTIEGVSKPALHRIQVAWLDAQVVQCGYCQPGCIMKAIALLEARSNQTKEEFKEAMSSNLCRCGTYSRIVDAIFKPSDKTVST